MNGGSMGGVVGYAVTSSPLSIYITYYNKRYPSNPYTRYGISQ